MPVSSEHAIREHAEAIVQTIREPLIVLDGDLRVKFANGSFYSAFHEFPESTVGRFIYDLGNGQWDIPELRRLIEEILPKQCYFENYEIIHDFPAIGRKRMLLNARRLDDVPMILLAIDDITERADAEAQIRESEVRLRQALEVAELGSWEHNFVTGTVECSEQCKKIFGLPLDSAVSPEVFQKMIFPEDFARIVETKERVLRQKPNRDFALEFRCTRPDGAVRWMAVRARIIVDDANRPLRIIGTTLDVTRSKEHEEALENSEAWLRLIADELPELVTTARPDGSKDYFNRPWFEYTGLTFEQSEGWNWTSAVHPEDIQESLERLKRGFAKGEPFELEWRLRRSDGVYRWHLLRCLPMRDGTHISHWIGTSTDIEDKRRIDEERARYLREESERRAQAEAAQGRAAFLNEASSALSSALDYVTVVERVAQLAVKQFCDGCTVDIVEEGNLIRRIATAHSNPAKHQLMLELARRYPTNLREPYGAGAALRSGKTEWRAQVSDSHLYALASDEEHLNLLRQLGLKCYIATPIRARGRSLGVIAIHWTETERSCDRGDLRLLEDLAHHVGMAIDNARLYRDAQKALFTAKKAIGAREEVLAIVSHDLKNPLNSIKLSAEILARGIPAGNPARKVVETMRPAIDRMNRMIGDLLDIASIDAGKLSMQRQPCAAPQLVNQVIEMFEAVASDKGNRLERDLEPNLPLVDVDPARIAQVLGNLVSNAIKFTPAGGVIRIRASRRGDEVCFEVRDAGPGIPEEQFEHLFDRYWQARETARLGTGLGLAIAKGIVEGHDGQIWVESKVGQGSTFYFTVRAVA
jgi:PAS domain S-box-containing protein